MLRLTLLSSVLCMLTTLFVSRSALAYPPGGIEKPIKGKEYPLTKERGPWMIMIATFLPQEELGQAASGKSPDQTADELIFELRELGLPAYKFVHDPANELIMTTDGHGREDRRKNLRRIRSVCVMGGNYKSIDDPLAQQTLEWVKKLHPKCLREGAALQIQHSLSKAGPLAAAFLTRNPTQSSKDLNPLIADDLQVKLNHGENYSLLENRAEYTLLVARFYGKSQTVDQAHEASAVRSFVDRLYSDTDLDNAALSARELTAVLRGNHDPTGAFNNIDAYIWHDRYESFVTVGSFTGPDDPRIQDYMAKFGPQVVKLDQTGANKATQPAHFGANGFGKKGDEARIWLFEAEPAIIQVPRRR